MSGGVPVTGTLPELGQNGVPVCGAKPALRRHSDPLNVQGGVNVRPVECRYPARYRNSVRIDLFLGAVAPGCCMNTIG